MPRPAPSRPSCAWSRGPPMPTGPTIASTCLAARSRTSPRSTSAAAAPRATGTDKNDVYLMLCFDDVKIVHATLHRSVRQAIEMITRENIARVIAATDRALKRLGTAAPKLAVGGLNPHAGEGGLFGREEIEIIKPAIEAAVAQGIAGTGPFGADTMFHRRGVDAFIVLLHVH